jgi:tRNA dimethylallyltransferase
MTAARPRRAAAPPLAAVLGPTAVGKTEFVLALAERLPIEVLVADSRQVYRGMDVGTAKPTAAERANVTHHLIDLVEPDEPFSVAIWVEQARTLIPQIISRGRLPVVVGGTGLYASALLDGLDLAAQPHAPELREQLVVEFEAGGLEPLAEQLTARDPLVAAQTDLRNPRRVLRALERSLAAGGRSDALVRSEPYPGRLALIGLSRPTEALDRRIDERAAAMFRDGLLDEAQSLIERGVSRTSPAGSGHGYAEAIQVAMGEWDIDRAIEVTARRVRRYARRQWRWFRRDTRIVWLDAGDDSAATPELVRRGSDLIGLLLRD